MVKNFLDTRCFCTYNLAPPGRDVSNLKQFWSYVQKLLDTRCFCTYYGAATGSAARKDFTFPSKYSQTFLRPIGQILVAFALARPRQKKNFFLSSIFLKKKKKIPAKVGRYVSRETLVAPLCETVSAIVPLVDWLESISEKVSFQVY